MAKIDRKIQARLYLFSEWDQTAEGEPVKDPQKPGVIIGTVDRTAAHREGRWHGCAWIILFRDKNLNEILVQDRTPEKMGGGRVGTRETLSAAGHLDERIRLKSRDRLPYTGIPHKVAYVELGQECFYERELPEDLLLVQLGYIRNREIKMRRPLERNYEHVWLYTGIYSTAKDFNFDPREAAGGKWRHRDALQEIIADSNVHQRRKHITDELVRALSYLNDMEQQLGGRAAFSIYLHELLVAEYDRIAEYKRNLYKRNLYRRKIGTT